MANNSNLTEVLTTTWRQHFPVAEFMQVEAIAFDGTALTTRAPLAPNTNIHQSAFAGSLYALQALTCWGLLYLQLAERQLDASIILATSHIDYHHTVKQTLEATCSHDARWLERLETDGKVRIDLNCTIADHASVYSGQYLVRNNQA